MPLRYFTFSTFVLTAAFGLSSLVAKNQLKASAQAEKQSVAPRIVKDAAQAKSISGSSIAPGGVGGRQSQFSAVFGG